MSKLIRCSAFFASYLPLYIMFGIKYWSSIETLHILIFLIAFLALSVISVTFLFVYTKLKLNKNKNSYYVTNIQKSSNNYSDYILTVILPLWAFDLKDKYQLFSFIFIWLILGFLYVKYNQVKYNIFDFLLYSTYSCDLYSLYKNEDGSVVKKYYANNISVIAGGKLKNYNNELVNIGKLSDDLLVIKSK